MKKYTLIILLAGFVFNTITAQKDYKQVIGAKIDKFISLSNDKKWNEAFDMMYPKLFESVTKEELINMMAEMDASGVEINIPSHEIKSYSVVAIHENEKFVFVEYQANQTLKLSEELTANEETRGALMFNLRSSFGTNSVVFDEETKAFNIDANKSLFAIADKNTDNWYLIENNEEQKELLNHVIPANIQEKFLK